MKQIIKRVALVGLLSTLAGCQPPGKLIDINGAQMHLDCSGPNGALNNGPTVILISGYNDDASTWDKVIEPLKTTTNLCAYDRAGLGFSDNGPQSERQMPLLQQVGNLEKLLIAAKVKKPLVVVGHSWGGLIARVYAQRNPQDVAAMVLIDSANEKQFSLLPQGYWDNYDQDSQDIVARFNQVVVTLLPMSDFGRLPLTVLSVNPPPYEEGEYRKYGITTQLYDKKTALYHRLQDEMAASSSRGERQLVPGNDHNIHHQHPQIVVQAIQKVISDSMPQGQG
jgi:pimeloyl-ACP methyl ester carboxylesterase